MAFTATTLSAAVAATDSFISLTSVSAVLPGIFIEIDQESFRVVNSYATGTNPVPVLRGVNGTVTSAHPVSAKVLIGLASDFSLPGTMGPVTENQAQRGRYTSSYSASGAITLGPSGTDTVAILNGTGALAMTLANPASDADGDLMIIGSNGKAAHTVTYAAGLGNGGATIDVGTFPAGNQTSVVLIAINGFWCPTSFTGATAAAGAPVWA